MLKTGEDTEEKGAGAKGQGAGEQEFFAPPTEVVRAEEEQAPPAWSEVNEELAGRVHQEVGDERLMAWYEEMVLMRRFEEFAGRAYRMGKIRGFCHLYIGQEAVATGAMAAIDERDYVITAYREHGQALARGLDPQAVMDELFGKATGCSGGKGGSMHLFDVERKFMGGWGIVGAQIGNGTGIAFALRYRGDAGVCLTFFGEGAIHQGIFHESFNLAELWNLPVVFVCENNRYAMGTDMHRISAETDIQRKALSYGMAHDCLNGQDVFAVYEGVGCAVRRAREESKPTFLDIRTYRFQGHSMSDPATYRSKDEVKREQDRDPIKRLRRFLVEQEIATEDQLDEIDKRYRDEVKEMGKRAEEAPLPDPEVLEQDVYVDWSYPID